MPADGPIHQPRDFEGRTISGYPVDAALQTFDMFATATGIDAGRVTVVKSPDTMEGQIAAMVRQGAVDGVFGFVNTIIAKAAVVGIDGVATLRFLTYAEYLPDMYGNTMFVTREFYERDKPALAGMVAAFNRALRETAADPDAAIDALMRRAPRAPRAVDRARLIGTLRGDMGHPEGRRLGVGDMDDARLRRMIDLVVAAKKLPRTPAIHEVFDRSFLPPLAERVTDMSRVPD
ncbi:ABC transporter substrate-binding protein [Sphingomonas sp. CL5.1]|nr:ABC transporter substrate-binding protein [Sphingomonas sp. CL5.1]